MHSNAALHCRIELELGVTLLECRSRNLETSFRAHGHRRGVAKDRVSRRRLDSCPLAVDPMLVQRRKPPFSPDCWGILQVARGTKADSSRSNKLVRQSEKLPLSVL